MAVFTKVSQENIHTFCEKYSITPTHIAEIQEGTENTNYLISTENDKYILTLYEGRTDVENLPKTIQFLKKLKEHKVNVPEILNGEIKQLQNKPATLQTFIEGSTPCTLTDSMCFQAGEMLGKIHKVSESIKLSTPAQITLQYLQGENEKALQASSPYKEMAEIIQAEIVNQKKQKNPPLPTGLIHGDYFTDNVFFDKSGRLTGVIDFWFCCTETYIYDLAIALNVWGFKKGEMINSHYEHFLKGYGSIRTLTKEEQTALPFELRRASIRFATSRLHDMVATNKNQPHKDPKTWIKRLEFHQNNG